MDERFQCLYLMLDKMYLRMEKNKHGELRCTVMDHLCSILSPTKKILQHFILQKKKKSHFKLINYKLYMKSAPK